VTTAIPAWFDSLGDLTFPQLAELMAGLGEKPYRARQIFQWINLRGAASFDSMTDLPLALRQKLSQGFRLRTLANAGREVAEDGTTKLLFRTPRGEPVESVVIPMPTGTTQCLSSQAGCKLGCAFCLTGHLALSGRNLGAGAIVDQLREAMQACPERPVDNLVFMGMGEPLFNYRNLLRAIRILTAEQGRNFSTRRITVSTAGVAPLIPRLGQEAGVFLAVSLNAANDSLRDRLMPINRRWPLATLHRALSDYPLPPRRRITIEYVLLAGVNDGAAQALEVADFLRGLRVKVNLIPFNPHAAAPFATPSEERIDAFARVLLGRGLSVQIRRSRGQDVKAACGQLGAGLDYRDLVVPEDPAE
jgi:23S rRNA (adenine2503-C2)-methyltransferase